MDNLAENLTSDFRQFREDLARLQREVPEFRPDPAVADAVSRVGSAGEYIRMHLESLPPDQRFSPESLRVIRGDLVRLAHWRIRRGTSWGRVVRVPAADELVVSRDCLLEDGGSYVVRLLAADGSLSSRDLVTVVGEGRTLRTTSAHGAVEGAIFVFGEEDLDTEVCVVLKVSHGPQRSAVLHLAPFGQDVADAAGFTAAADGGQGASSSTSPPTLSPVSNRGGISFAT